MKRIITIVGARPQFIKAAAVSRALRESFEGRLSERIVHTGQHHDADMSDIFFDELDIPRPALTLGIAGGTHGSMTGRMLESIERVLIDERPDWVLIYGDTNSTLAGALAAAKLHIPVGHVEAGLRSFNRRMPEEINRVMADHVSERLFAPTDVAVDNLRKEGVPEARIVRTGDVMYDAALFYAKRANRDVLRRLGVEPGRYVIATIHRAENTDSPERLEAIVAGLEAAARDIPVVLPLHPRTAKVLAGKGRQLSRGIITTTPLGYLDMTAVTSNSKLVVTDSGGLQKEAYFFGVPCVTLRDETEWVETVTSGWNRLVMPTGVSVVESGIANALGDKVPTSRPELYGDGHASEQILRVLAS